MRATTIFNTGDHAVVRTFCGSFSDMDHLQEELHGEHGICASPAVNIAETATKYLLELALPGYRQKDLHIMIEDDILIIRGTASCVPEHYEEVQRFFRKEFCIESFTRTFLLPEDVHASSAHLEGGILFIHLTRGAVRVLPVNGPCNTEIIPIN